MVCVGMHVCVRCSHLKELHSPGFTQYTRLGKHRNVCAFTCGSAGHAFFISANFISIVDIIRSGLALSIEALASLKSTSL